MKAKALSTLLVTITLATSCNQISENQIIQPLEQNTEISSAKSNVPYSSKLSPSILNVINAPEPAQNPQNTEIKPSEIGPEYVNHFKFFTTIDINGSGVEEVLGNDGYTNAQKYVAYWRNTLGENLDWPDHHSTTYNGPFPALEHGLIKNDKGWFGLKNASQKADEYYDNAVKAWKKGLPADAPEQKEAWEWLGRTAHFIQDVTVPHHSYSLLRLDQLTHNPFEKAVSKNFEKYLPSKNYDGGVWNGKGPYPQGEKWGIYFDSRLPGNVIKNNATIARGLFKIANHKEDENNGNWDKVRALVLPLANKTCAGIVVSFLQQVGEKP
ncbi:MAG: zinc dependent phospholipase C family protein [Candidatus Sericytochromatia bacterium]